MKTQTTQIKQMQITLKHGAKRARNKGHFKQSAPQTKCPRMTSSFLDSSGNHANVTDLPALAHVPKPTLVNDVMIRES